MRRVPTIVSLGSMVFVALVAGAPPAAAADSPMGGTYLMKGQNDMTAMVGNMPQGKSTEVWVRQ